MKYKEYMDKIQLTPNAEKRILQNIDYITNTNAVKKPLYSKLLGTVAVLALVCVSAFSIHYFTTIDSESDLVYSPYTEEYESLDELSKAIGYNLDYINNLENTLPFKVNTINYNILADIGQINYVGTDNEMTLRISKGNEDISGNYSSFSNIKTIDNITLKGNSNTYTLALWTNNDFSYSVDFQKGIDEATMLNIANFLHN